LRGKTNGVSINVLLIRDKQAELADPPIIWDDEDEATLAAIDQGMAEIEGGQGIPEE
jgi:hypothetical protein